MKCIRCGKVFDDQTPGFDYKNWRFCGPCFQVVSGMPAPPVVAAPAVANSTPIVILTTTPALAGFRVIRTIDVITAECVLGLNVFRDLLASITDIVGGRSGTTQTALRDARHRCLSELRQEAALLGANAVIAVNLHYGDFSGQDKSMIFLVASGTAVIVEAEAPPPAIVALAEDESVADAAQSELSVTE